MINFDTRSEMISYLIPPGMVIAEIGVFKGDFAKELLAREPSKLYLVDYWKAGPTPSADVDGNNRIVVPNMEVVYHQLVEEYKNNPIVEIRRSWSNEFLKSIPDSSLDVIYIDADHSYEGAKSDLELCYSKVKLGGLIMGHDYEMNFKKAKKNWKFGVRRAVDEFCQNYGLSIFCKGFDGCVSFCIIKA